MLVLKEFLITLILHIIEVWLAVEVWYAGLKIMLEIISLQVNIIDIYINIHLAWKVKVIVLMLVVYLLLLFRFLIILKFKSRFVKFFVNAAHSIVHHFCKNKVTGCFVRFLFERNIT